MDNRSTQTVNRQTTADFLASYDRDGDELTQQRLNKLLAVNAETANEEALYASEREKFEAELIKNPLTSEKAFSYLGLLLGTFPPAAIFARMLFEKGSFQGDEFWIVGVLAIVNLITALVGFFSGRLIGRMVRETEKFSWVKMLVLLPLIGILWGIMSGGAGGIIIFVVGAFFGAFFGAMVGGIALPIFTLFHRLLKKGDLIERDQFLPIAFGVTFIICSFILGS